MSTELEKKKCEGEFYKEKQKEGYTICICSNFKKGVMADNLPSAMCDIFCPIGSGAEK